MSDYFEVETSPGHVGIEFKDSVTARLDLLRQQAEEVGVGKSAAFEPEVDYLREIVVDLRAELPSAMKAVRWPEAMASGDKLDDFILMVFKDPARAARGRGTNASAKVALFGLDAA